MSMHTGLTMDGPFPQTSRSIKRKFGNVLFLLSFKVYTTVTSFLLYHKLFIPAVYIYSFRLCVWLFFCKYELTILQTSRRKYGSQRRLWTVRARVLGSTPPVCAAPRLASTHVAARLGMRGSAPSVRVGTNTIYSPTACRLNEKCYNQLYVRNNSLPLPSLISILLYGNTDN